MTVRTQVPVAFAMRTLRRVGPARACRLAGRFGWNSHAWAYALRLGGARCERGVWSA